MDLSNLKVYVKTLMKGIPGLPPTAFGYVDAFFSLDWGKPLPCGDGIYTVEGIDKQGRKVWVQITVEDEEMVPAAWRSKMGGKQ